MKGESGSGGGELVRRVLFTDYGDILPPECRLTRNDISRLTDFWGTYEKSATELNSSLRAFDILMKPVPIVSRVPKLEPLDDVMYMPPPPWE
ncbi:hypothetical protein Pmani_025807 [Petrolisthes manimaculis]|uniref:Uncharacterized protein n=1 Tax=Petrolisthes manimaculis TaxID=1843537 RepID=A0AAE1P4R8_9EUCA|nr:hypothetical protein Pmani_025807 [Petrolisthes manimaculis]